MPDFGRMTDAQRKEYIDDLVDDLSLTVHGKPVVAIAAALGTIVGRSLDRVDLDVFLLTLTTNAQLEAYSACGCSDCLAEKQQLLATMAYTGGQITIQ